MTTLRIGADAAPGSAPHVAPALIRLRERLAFLGLLPLDGDASDLDALAEETLTALEELGVGAVVRVRLRASRDPAVWQQGLTRLLDHVEASPAPAGTWPVLVDVVGHELLARLVGASRASVDRYRTGQRATPDDVAARLHAVAMICADLAGSYNAFGIRRWFARPRSALDGRAPRELLAGDWDPDEPGPRAVRDLAAALVEPGAT